MNSTRNTGVNKPFLVPKQPVILKKKVLGEDKYIYIYMVSYLDRNYVLDDKGYVVRQKEKYSIYFYPLDPTDHSKNLTDYCNGYAILADNLFGKVNLRFTHADEIGLNFVIFPQSMGIGSVIINHLFYWAKENYPKLKVPVLDIGWPNDDAAGNNKRRRDKLYKKIGLVGGNALHIADLTPIIETRGFEIYPATEFITQILFENNCLKSSNKELNRILDSRINIIEEERAVNNEIYHSVTLRSLFFNLENVLLIMLGLFTRLVLAPYSWIFNKIKKTE